MTMSIPSVPAFPANDHDSRQGRISLFWRRLPDPNLNRNLNLPCAESRIRIKIRRGYPNLLGCALATEAPCEYCSLNTASWTSLVAFIILPDENR